VGLPGKHPGFKTGEGGHGSHLTHRHSCPSNQSSSRLLPNRQPGKLPLALTS